MSTRNVYDSPPNERKYVTLSVRNRAIVFAIALFTVFALLVATPTPSQVRDVPVLYEIAQVVGPVEANAALNWCSHGLVGYANTHSQYAGTERLVFKSHKTVRGIHWHYIQHQYRRWVGGRAYWTGISQWAGGTSTVRC